MPVPLAAIAVPVGTAVTTVMSYMFRYAITRWAIYAGLFALISTGGYFIAEWILPPWFNLQTLRDSIGLAHPAVSYGLHLFSFYEGFPLALTALVSAWVVKKLPGWVWLGPMYRLFNTSTGPK